MHKSLIEYITNRVELNQQEIDLVNEVFVPKKIRKNQYLLQEGEICNFTAFVVKGALRKYIVDEKGNELITQFALEGWWMSDRESLANETPSSYNIEALEHSELLIISKEDSTLLENTVPSYKRLVDLLKEQNAVAGQKRVVRALSYSAEEKYNEFIENYPNIVQRVPQHMIASYLGITPETLSRLRKKIAK